MLRPARHLPPRDADRGRRPQGRGVPRDARRPVTSCFVVLIAFASAAHADKPLDRPEAIEVDRADTPAGRTELGFDGGAPLEGWGATLSTGWLERPIAFGDLHPVRRREVLVVGGALALGPSIVIDARLGAAHQIGDRLGTRALDNWVSTDLRLGARVHVVGDAARSAFVRVDASLPTGDDGDFAGEASWSLAWRLIGRITVPAGIVVAASAGIRLRGQEVVIGDRLVGDEGVVAIGMVVPLPAVAPLWCAEGVKLTGELVAILGNDVGVGKGPSPVEARLGVVTRPTREITIGVRAGTGINDEIGAPKYRATVELSYTR